MIDSSTFPFRAGHRQRNHSLCLLYDMVIILSQSLAPLVPYDMMALLPRLIMASA